MIVVWGAMADKDLQKTLSCIAMIADTIILTKPEGERSAEPKLLYENVPESLRDRCSLVANVDAALCEAEKKADEDDLILIAGSLYLIGEARKILVGELVQ